MGNAAVYLLSGDAQGNRRWCFAAGDRVYGDWVIPNSTTTSGPRFGADNNPADLQVKLCGNLVFDIDCNGGRADVQSPLAGLGKGSLTLLGAMRIAGLAGVD